VGETLIVWRRMARFLAFSILKRIGVGETYSSSRWGTWPLTFSILKRIGVGETSGCVATPSQLALSVSSNGSEWVKLHFDQRPVLVNQLSVSSNGSEWVKQARARLIAWAVVAFSILKRIGVGETTCSSTNHTARRSFSILKRIGVGETSL